MDLHDINDLLLQIYRAARELPASEFPDFSFNFLKKMVPFDSAAWWVSLGMREQGAVAEGVHLYNKSAEMVQDWQAINRRDPVLEALKARPGKGVIFHPPTLFASPDMADVRDYARRHEHQNGLSTVALAPGSARGHGFALYRADTDRFFSEVDRTMMELLVPHFHEALKINRQLSLPVHLQSSDPTEIGSVAIAGFDGVLRHCGSGFLRLMALEWPMWDMPRLPEPLMAALERAGSRGFSGEQIQLDMEISGGMLILRARILPIQERHISPVDLLSPRELRAAKLFGEGLSYKEIAREMDVAPATTRNFLQRAYRKLGIQNKTELTMLLMQELDGKGAS
jgi:DNA-binding CsgD family transcriptional regulator